MIIDLGCGSWCRGDIGIDLDFSTPPITKHLDDIIGLTLNKEAKLITADLNDRVSWYNKLPPAKELKNATFLMIHILESIESPFRLLEEIARFKPKKLIIVVPNCQQNLVDWYDSTHIYSFTEASIRQLVSRFFNVKAVKLIIRNQDIAVVAESK